MFGLETIPDSLALMKARHGQLANCFIWDCSTLGLIITFAFNRSHATFFLSVLLFSRSFQRNSEI